jgi:hypothetical protein
MADEDMERLICKVREATDEISRQLGYRPREAELVASAP